MAEQARIGLDRTLSPHRKRAFLHDDTTVGDMVRAPAVIASLIASLIASIELDFARFISLSGEGFCPSA